MPHYLSRGSIPKKRHTAHRTSPGFKDEGIYYEEVITTQGFSRAYSIAYHLRPPTRVKHIEPAGTIAVDVAEQAVLRHHHLKSGTMPTKGDPVTGRVPMFTNADVTMWRCRPAQSQAELYRNALADEVIFVHKGAGRLLTAFGVLPFKPFDYVVIPRCTTYKLDFDPGTQSDLLVVESAGQVSVPAKYLNHDGQLRLGAPYAERDLHGPTDLFVLDEEKDTSVVVKDGAKLSRYVLANHPFDVIGWDGQVYPFTFNADDFEPITGTIHQPPPIHLTFETPGFVLCTFAPRMLDTHPDAIKVPYAHSNVESDEVLYYVRGKFGSRRGVEEASFTLHPHGIPHGPHPGTIVASRDVKWTDELAVMVDTFRPLFVTKQSLELDDPKYPYSWLD
ncbi:homogentisate -dioxygenase : Homogentisate 1,2-dioxygenase OS=Singulisphaera acidiphila (strain ATCC BAA-1392 / DSM 18658 / VKM B-2454 / MOB10) GN=Sinac_1066 PE=4 SV=1: HgmA [Gemmata massiliana]|uniref:Homogentisate 1,2-dioxygenase N-terminal domain-containing protein n=1 Tax=Gemmata massiliana TaxID=1210884 RepID=A0A6P2CSE3_9BACT|nr:homogentisate 1,2-dioxygenase [Gemmata massiliana]VTR91537.1 homogentisate -dioxygenase : Homogentisate 1,2-dioxygenase OS=Singulisphaera acidiphila (strain ATCC BAA-1392 / DSM 18658 / VKM B-2454 / MOB10) GN=Sinac_1066 PE=4 SV=1: HgmA [Gemmata massiliana]